MAQKLVLAILASALLSLAMAMICRLAFPDVVPYTPGEDDAISWQRQIAFLLEATAWISAEVSGLFVIVLAARLWKRHSFKQS